MTSILVFMIIIVFAVMTIMYSTTNDLQKVNDRAKGYLTTTMTIKKPSVDDSFDALEETQS